MARVDDGSTKTDHLSLYFHLDCQRRRPGAADAVHRARAPAEQTGAPQRRGELLHAGPGQLQRRRAAHVVPAPAVPGAAASGVVHDDHAREHGGVRARRRGRQVRDAALPLHLHQRQGAAQRALLLARVAHLGRRGGAARMAAVQAPQDAGVAVLHPPAPAAVEVLVARRGEAPPLHRAAHLAKAQPGRPTVTLSALCGLRRSKNRTGMKLFFPGTLHSMYTSILELCCVAQLETAFNPFFSVSSYNNLNSTFSTGQSWFGKKKRNGT
jgi:hypothetical protein